jgi:hypothetical protein
MLTKRRTHNDAQQPLMPSARASRALPRDLRGLALYDVETAELSGQSLGVVDDPRRGQFVACVRVEGGSFAMAPAREQEHRLQRWGDLVATIANSSSLVRRIGFVSRSIPSDSNRQLDYFESAGDPDAGTDVRGSYLELLERYERSADQREVLVWISTARASGAQRQERLEALAGEVVRLCHLLGRAQIHVTQILDRIDLGLAIRAAYDPWGRADRLEYARRIRAQAPERVGDLLEIAPAALDPRWHELHADRGLHRTAWVSQWPRTEVGALFLLPLVVNPNVVRSVAWVAELEDPARALRDINTQAIDARSDATSLDRMQQRPTITKQQRWRGIFERERELGAGHAKVAHNAYVTTSVLGDDVRALDRAWERTRQNAAAAQLQLQVLPRRQDQALTMTMPLGRGIR